jgi:GDP/UDP-N,N'-diacetylbacillosamine 2-epimerase (hydrolysing)
MHEDVSVELVIFALGMHVSDTFGLTHKDIDPKFQKRLGKNTLGNTDSKFDIAASIGRTSIEAARLLAKEQEASKAAFDYILCLGDRFEMFGAASAVVPFNIPLAHLHGGEVSWGAIDDKFRHAMSKMADYHFTSCKLHKQRVLSMGASPERVHNVGALGIENISKLQLLSTAQFKQKYDVDMTKPTVVATYHPVTTELEDSATQLNEFLKFIQQSPYQFVITTSTADTNGLMFREKLNKVASVGTRIHVFDNLGATAYHSALKHCAIVIGNSSSGIIEVATHNKPVVNIGNRQKGRECSSNTVHCGVHCQEIMAAFRKCEGMMGQRFKNVYAQENTSSRILSILKSSKPSCDYGFHMPKA